jgi:alpha/beta superfamily hydrolase
MAKPPRAEKLFVDGPAGRLESILERPAELDPIGKVVVCHPHPQYGGTMQNKVAHTLARAFVYAGFTTLRFNFRGTGQSDGEYDHGDGELDDAVAAMNWLRHRESQLPFWLAGFSFGAAIAIRAAVATPVDGLVSVAPAISSFASDLEAQPDCPWLIVQGDKDELVDVDETVEWIDSLSPGPELLIIPGAEHFFHGRLIELRGVVVEFIQDSAE